MLDIELLQLKHSSSASKTHYVGESLQALLFKNFFTEFIPILLSILGKVFMISKLTWTDWGYKFELLRSSIISDIWFVSFILDGNSLVKYIVKLQKVVKLVKQL